MKKLLAIILTSMLLILLLGLPVMAESDYNVNEVDGPEYVDISGIDTPTGNLPNITGDGGDQYYDIDPPLIPTGGIVPTGGPVTDASGNPISPQTNDNSNMTVLITVSVISLAGVCVMALMSRSNKKKI